jgi:hypothetical protein
VIDFGLRFLYFTNAASVTRALQNANDQVAGIAGGVGKSPQEKRLNSLSARITESLIGLGIPLALASGFLQAAGGAAAFAEQVQRVQIVTGQLGSDLGTISSRFMRLANSTGQSAESIATVAEIIGTKGLASRLSGGQFEDLLGTTAKFAQLTKLSMTTAGEQLSDVAVQLRFFENEGPDIFHRFTSAIQAVGKASVSDSKQVLEFVKALAPLRVEGNFALHEIIGLAGAVKSFGGEITKSLVRTQFGAMFGKMATNTEEFSKFLGIGSSQKLTQMLNETPFKAMLLLAKKLQPLRGNLGDMRKKLDELGLSGQRLAPFMAGLAGQIDLVQSTTELARKNLSGLSDVLEEDFLTLLDTATKQAELLRAKLHSIGLVVGETILPALTVVLKIFNLVAGAVYALADTAGGKFLILVGFIASVGTAAISSFNAISSMMVMFGGPALGAALWTVFALFGEIFGIAMLVVGAFKLIAPIFKNLFGAGLSLLTENISLIYEGVTGFLEGPISVSLFQKIVDAGLFPIVQVILMMIDHWGDFKKGFMEGLILITDASGPFVDMVKDFFEYLNEMAVFKLSMDDGGKAAKELGRTLGHLFFLTVSGILQIGQGLLELTRILLKLAYVATNPLVLAALGALGGFMIGGAPGAGLGAIAGLVGAASMGMRWAPMAQPVNRPAFAFKNNQFVGATTGAAAGGDLTSALPMIGKALRQGYLTPETGKPLLTAQVRGDVRLDAVRVGEVLSHTQRRLNLRQGGVVDDLDTMAADLMPADRSSGRGF